jgi:hypothetical protein
MSDEVTERAASWVTASASARSPMIGRTLLTMLRYSALKSSS